MKIMSIPIALASKSPRRQQLLQEAGFQFRVVLPNAEEIYPAEMDPKEVPCFLSQIKAKAAIPLAKPEEVILAADTIVIFEDTIYEKPKDREGAIRILQALSGNTHEVITGVTLLSPKKEMSFCGHTSVTMEALSLDEINFYIDNFNPFDKAGAYGIQEWIGHCKVASITGSYLNVMGLPVNLVYKHLESFT